MGSEEKKSVQRIADAFSTLPNEKREFILGYAEGVISMASAAEIARENPCKGT